MRKSPVRLTDSMRRKVAAEYAAAPKLEKAAIAARYNVSKSICSVWVKRGLGTARTARTARTADGQLESALYRLVLHGRQAGVISRDEARELLGLVIS